MSFEIELFDWIDRSLAEPIQDSIIAFCFNLSEPASNTAKYAIELIGSTIFTPQDTNWACCEDFVPSQRSIGIPNSFCSGDWHECLSIISNLVKQYVASNRTGAKILSTRRGIAIGFVDGDLELIKS